MPVLAYFTLPIGHPVDGTEKLVPAESERVCDVLSSSDPDGAYQLYQCVDMDGIPANVTPVCMVHKPLLSTLPKVYLDTSAVSYLKQDDSPEKTSITRKFWEAAKAHKFFLYLSDVTLEELLRCPEPKRSVLFDFLREVTYTKIVSTECEGFESLTKAISDTGILPKRSVADISHIAAAIHARCDVIASWNFKHMSNRRTVSGVRTVALQNSCGSIDIMTPEQIMEVYL